MGSMASSATTHNPFLKSLTISSKIQSASFTPTHVVTSQQQPPPLPPPQKKTTEQVSRREVILRSSEFAVLGAIFHFSGQRPKYLGVQKNPPALALCPATNNCVSTSENISDLSHYAPPWYVILTSTSSQSSIPKSWKLMLQLCATFLVGGVRFDNSQLHYTNGFERIKSTAPDNFTPRIVEKKDDYVRVEYESPILGFIDDVEFWFPPGKKPLVQYRSASRIWSFDFDINRKRIKALRIALEKKGWASEETS